MALVALAEGVEQAEGAAHAREHVVGQAIVQRAVDVP